MSKIECNVHVHFGFVLLCFSFVCFLAGFFFFFVPFFFLVCMVHKSDFKDHPYVYLCNIVNVSSQLHH